MGEDVEKIGCRVEIHPGLPPLPCRHEVWDKEENKCVFHSSKVEQKEEIFKEKLKNYIKEIESRSANKKYDFRKFVFPSVSFSRKVFSKPADFLYAQFQNEADFSVAQFRSEADFSGAQFQNGASFSAAQFQNEANFSETKFQNEVDFSWSKFQNLAYFSKANFQNRANFNNVGFLKETYFTETILEGFSSFYQARISNKFFFQYTKIAMLDFRDVSIEREAEVLFYAVNLSKALFLNTNLSNIDFANVNWGKDLELFRKRHRLYDEELHDNENERKVFNDIVSQDNQDNVYSQYLPDLPGLENLYRQLKKKYDEKTNYPAAGNFHKGEMEVIRRRTKRSKLLSFDKLDFLVSTIYKYASYYGEDYRLSLFWIFVLWFVLTNLFMLQGFTEPNQQGETIQYYFTLHIPILESQYWKDFIIVLKHSLSIIYFTHIVQKTGSEESYFNVFGHITSVVLHALFLLALRRRFKR